MSGLISSSLDVIVQRRRKKIIWVSFLMIDVFLHKTSRIEILEHLAELGNDVYLFAVRSKKRFQMTNSNVNLILIPLRYLPIIAPFLFSLIVFIFLPFYIAVKKPNIIITEPGPSIFAFLWKLFLFPSDFKIILDIRSTIVEVNNFRRYLDVLFFNISVEVAKKIFDGITIITALMKEEICTKFHINPGFVGVWTSGVSMRLFKPEGYDRMDMRKKLGLANEFVIFYHGHFSSNRGIVESVKSIEQLESKYHDVVLFLLGNGPIFPVLEQLIQKKKLQERVIIHDTVDYTQVSKYIAMCDVGIVPLPDLPDWRNQCPLNLLEYLAMKKVVIVTDIPANRQIIGKSKCGIYAPSADPKEIAKAVKYSYDNKERLKQWGAYGGAIVSENYTWTKVAKDLNDYLLKIA